MDTAQKERDRLARIRLGLVTQFVYVIEAVGLNRYKIGHSEDPEYRLYQMRGHSPVELQILGVKEITHEKAVTFESNLHALFKKNNVHFEWFELNKEELQLLLSYMRD